MSTEQRAEKVLNVAWVNLGRVVGAVGVVLLVSLPLTWILTEELGALVMERLSPIDRVAYVRFASVYRNFQDAGEFQEFVDEMTAAQKREALRRNQVEFLF